MIIDYISSKINKVISVLRFDYKRTKPAVNVHKASMQRIIRRIINVTNIEFASNHTYYKAHNLGNSSDLLHFLYIRFIIFLMRKEIEYKKQQQLNTLLSELPDYVRSYTDYCLGTLNRSYNTVIVYTYDIRLFFRFLISRNPLVSTYNDVTIDILNQLSPLDMQEYMSYLRLYEGNGEMVHNEATSRARKLSSLRSFFQYLFVYNGLLTNVAKLIDTPRINRKKKSNLTDEKAVNLLENTKACIGKDTARKYLERTQLRDTAIITTLIYTGIRVSELCNLDLDDIHRDTLTILVTRKGGKQEEVVMNESVRKAIDQYIDFERVCYDDANRALFLSSRHATGNRLTPRSVELIIEKYGATIGEHVTPHTLRRTFGTKLYNQTGDPYLTATALGHKNIQTTVEFYASMEEKRKDLIRNVNYEEPKVNAKKEDD